MGAWTIRGSLRVPGSSRLGSRRHESELAQAPCTILTPIEESDAVSKAHYDYKEIEDDVDSKESSTVKLESGVRGNLRGSVLRGAIASCCGLAFLLFGYDQGVLGSILGLESFQRDFHHPSSQLEGLFASVYDIGCLIGAIIAFVTADRFGRKGSIKLGSWIMMIGTSLQISAMGKQQMIFSRMLTGIGNGINTVNVPIWQSESFKSHNRGALLIIQSALIALGHPLSTFMGLISRQLEPSSFAWRWPIAFQGVFIVLILMLLPFLPESPRWLIQHGKIEQATDAFARLEGYESTIYDADVIRERDSIVTAVQDEKKLGQATWAEIFTEGRKRNISRVLLGAGPYMFNQWGGINSLAYFLPITFERNIGLSKETSLIIAGVLGLQYFFISWLPFFFIETMGRRKLLISSAAACSACMLVISFALHVDTYLTRWIFVAFCFFFFDSFALGILPVSWMYASEIMPLRTRNKGVALGVAAHWLSNFVVVYITPLAIEQLGASLYLIWAATNALFVPITYFFYPETAQRTLEDMDEVFEKERFGITRTRDPGSLTESSGEENSSFD